MRKLPTPARMEAFSDGVIAVIITIMVLEFKVPHQPGLRGLLTILPTFAVYALSFTFTGIYWVNHHYMVDRLRRVDAGILWTNLLFLFCISLIPFFTDYAVVHQFDSFSVALYAGSMLVDGLAFTLIGKAIQRHLRRHSAAYDPDEAQSGYAEQIAENRKALLSVLLYLIAIATSHWHPAAALAVTAVVAAVWIIPGFQVGPRQPVETTRL